MSTTDWYLHTSLYLKLNKQKTRYPRRKPICLFCDLDDTYIMKYWPSEQLLEQYPQKYTDTILSPDLRVYDETIQLKSYLDQNSIPLLLVSGRDLHQMKELEKSFLQHMPDHPEIMEYDGLIGGVGTELFLKKDSGRLENDKSYMRVLAQTGYDRSSLYKLIQKHIPIVISRFAPVAFNFSKRDQEQSEDELPIQQFKVSVEFKSDDKTAKNIYDYIRSLLDNSGMRSVRTLLSCPYHIDTKISKYNFDIVPFSKEKPIQYLKSIFDMHAVVAGDSGNDFEMLVYAADTGIIVGNAKKELLNAYQGLSNQEKKHVILDMKNQGPDAILHYVKTIVNI
jgi:HAD superfamily hydrolase (TIGR01484 family)